MQLVKPVVTATIAVVLCSLTFISVDARFTPSHRMHKRATTATATNFTLVNSYSGDTFFDGWTFFSNADPTHGMVQYTTQAQAQSAGLIGIQDGRAMMKVAADADTDGNRQSVRISTVDTHTHGLFVLDATHIPVGCGVWPAFWTLSADPGSSGWPVGGEIDIVEGVNDYSANLVSIHTSSGCSLSSSSASTLGYSGELMLGSSGTSCDSLTTNNQGCSIMSTTSGDYGVQYNADGGGVHAMLWDADEGISIWFFPRASIPSDVSSGTPDPTGWPTPTGRWPATSCTMSSFFWNHVAIFTNTLCGDWAGASSVWSTAMNGQTQSCAAKTGVASCADYMHGNSTDLSEAYWLINSVKIYQTERLA
ncbi:glycoside hydrolase family 16 protein [Tilletiaria anomala UBC 951]|uniref:Glycoside hydrolase family 16 protein n=1 Tax=Tilletiaria anomala (strain ATCC 24038 / CBS 436.72 / UBC 951) TaxID=1037660 RepID=A0A066VJR4_TILAU|nr:glycoside hydrolase family 16 protein [Tilletiaria anomala UBC 951]KDN41962.1 glycoside hydrolase family 16 protein [Tilletiaria anomala UBC 951]